MDVSLTKNICYTDHHYDGVVCTEANNLSAKATKYDYKLEYHLELQLELIPIFYGSQTKGKYCPKPIQRFGSS